MGTKGWLSVVVVSSSTGKIVRMNHTEVLHYMQRRRSFRLLYGAIGCDDRLGNRLEKCCMMMMMIHSSRVFC